MHKLDISKLWYCSKHTINSAYFKFTAILVWVAAVLLLVLPLPTVPQVSLDGSWVFALAEAYSAHMSFGNQIIFTFGPYNFLWTHLMFPEFLRFGMLMAILWAISYALCSAALAKSFFNRWRAYFLIFIISFYVPAQPDAFFQWSLFLAYFAVLTHANQNKSIFYWAGIILLAFAPLIKASFVISSIGALCLITFFLGYKKQYLQAAYLLSGWLLVSLLLWNAAGQAIADLPVYYFNSIIEAFYYGDAMSLVGNGWRVIYTIIAFASVLLVMWRERFTTPYGRFVFLGLSLILFTTFKMAFIRHDDHDLIAVGALYCLTAYILMRQLNCFNILVALLTLSASNYISPISFSTHSLTSQALALENRSHAILDILNGAPEFCASFASAIQDIKKNNPLPSFNGTVDSVSAHQSEIIANGLNYDPRPTLQSFEATGPFLLESNRNWILKHRPEHILFQLEPIDEHYPTLEEGRLMPDWLSRYTPSGQTSNGLLILNARPDKAFETAAPVITPLVDITAHIGEEIHIPTASLILLAEIDVTPTLYGQIMGLLYKRSQMTIQVHTVTNQTYNHRFIPAMARSGFMLSPYLANIGSFEWLAKNPDKTSPDVPLIDAFTIDESVSGLRSWSDVYHVRLYTVHILN